MTTFYVETVDDWSIWSVTVNADDELDAYVKAVRQMPEGYSDLPLKIVNRSTYETTIVICHSCPECAVPVYENDEWMLTDIAGEYQHVDCYQPGRINHADH